MELIKITERLIGAKTIQAVSARNLHLKLELKTEFTAWVKQFLDDFTENVDFIEVELPLNFGHNSNLLQGAPKTEYAFSVDMAKQVAMLTRTPKGKEVRLYFIECEKKLSDMSRLDPILQALIKSNLEQIAQREQIAQLELTVDKISFKQKLQDGDTGYQTVLAYGRIHNYNIPLLSAKALGKACSRICKERGIPIGQVKDERFGTINSYPTYILAEVFQ